MEPAIYARELSSLASLRIGDGSLATAEACLRRAIDLDDQLLYRLNLVSAMLRRGDSERALTLVEAILDANPMIPGAWSLLGVAHMGMGAYNSARDAFALAADYEPGNPSYHLDLASALMLLGEWDRGWDEYEHRVPLTGHQFSLPTWDGQPNRHVLVSCEQGAGDTIQFARYIPVLKQAVDKITFAVPASMYSLLQGYKQWCDIVPGRIAPPGPEQEVLLMSLPRTFGTMPDTVPPDPGVLATADISGLAAAAPFKVGICWAGSAGHLADRRRSIPFEAMLPLAYNSKRALFSFQVGKRSADIAAAGAQALVSDLSGIIEPKWSAAATFLKQMDAVVTCDTGIAHLAAALGVSTCLLISVHPDWRWLATAGDKTPWYPSMHIIRQEKMFDWDGPVRDASAWLDGVMVVNNA